MADSSIEEFNPKGKNYYFNNCTEDFCYKNRHGICSLDLTEKEVELIPMKEYFGEDDVNYCRNIYQSLIKDGQKRPIYIHDNRCGHYMFSDGQHRVCIASRKGLKLQATIQHNDEICQLCHKEKKFQESIDFWSKVVKKTTPAKTIVHKILRIVPRSKYQDTLERLKKELADFQSEKDRDYREF